MMTPALNEPAEREAYKEWAGTSFSYLGESGWLARARIAAEREAELVKALELARNRLQLIAVREVSLGSKHAYEVSEWAEQARATLAPESGR